jgi:hypothetical protein
LGGIRVIGELVASVLTYALALAMFGLGYVIARFVFEMSETETVAVGFGVVYAVAFCTRLGEM